MPLPDLSNVCATVPVVPQSLHVTLPGGAALSAQLAAAGVPDPIELPKALMAQANAALAPLVPLFNVLDVVLALFKVVKAIPDSLGPPPDPSKIAQVMPDLVEKANKLLQLVPQLSVPLMIVGLIDTLLAFLEGMRGQLHAIVDAEAKLAASATRAAELGNVQLQAVVDRARGNLTAQMQNLSAGAGPVNRLVGLLNLFLGLAGLPTLPDLADLGPDAAAALAPLDAVVTTLRTVRSAIPA